jgi:hypothetical protein
MKANTVTFAMSVSMALGMAPAREGQASARGARHSGKGRAALIVVESYAIFPFNLSGKKPNLDAAPPR